MPSRREFLQLAALAGAGLAFGGGACSGNSEVRTATGGANTSRPTLRIALTNHFVPAYDTWFDREYVRQWGERHDVTVVVDHYPLGDILTRVQAEVAAHRGHDIVGLFSGNPAVFEDDAIDHRDLIEAVEAKVGEPTPAMRRETRNSLTGKYFAFPDSWIPSVVHYRTDLWNTSIDTWAGVVEGGARLKGAGAPVGIGLGPGVDNGLSAFGLLFAHGASLQDEEGRLALDRPSTVEAVEAAVRLYRAAMTEDVLSWDDASDNRALALGRASLTLDPISAIRAIEDQEPALAGKIGLQPVPAGPAGRRFSQAAQTYVIFEFSPNQAIAKQFLVDLALGYREVFVRSRFYNLPAFPGAVPDLSELVANDAGGKYTVLAGAADWSTNIGHPGGTNGATAEVFNQGLLSNMFAAACRDELSAEEAVKRAAAEAQPIFTKWRERGKI